MKVAVGRIVEIIFGFATVACAVRYDSGKHKPFINSVRSNGPVCESGLHGHCKTVIRSSAVISAGKLIFKIWLEPGLPQVQAEAYIF